MGMKFEKQPSKFIKPLTPTPLNLKHYKIGLIDEVAALMNVATVLFFTENSIRNPKFSVAQLENSLQKTLSRLYPLAGRYIEETQTVECNDEGVEFIEAKVNIKLEDILGPEVNTRLVDEFIPLKTKPRDVVLTIQLTTFECGGVALGVSATHRVADASTLCTFLNEWAALNREENETEFMGPGFNSSSLFPARGLPPIVPLLTDDELLSKYTRKKLSFSESAISNMKAKAITSGKAGTRRLSKLQLVSAIICKALIGVDRAIHGRLRESVLLQPINIRGKTASPIPKSSCGNLLGLCITESKILETTEELANLLNECVMRTIDDYSKLHHDSEQGQMMVLNSVFTLTKIPESANVITLSSWCKFPFYEVDFGFGKPVWAVPGTMPMKNSAQFIDGMGGDGIEAYIVLEVKDVPYFEEALDVNGFGA